MLAGHGPVSLRNFGSADDISDEELDSYVDEALKEKEKEDAAALQAVMAELEAELADAKTPEQKESVLQKIESYSATGVKVAGSLFDLYQKVNSSLNRPPVIQPKETGFMQSGFGTSGNVALAVGAAVVLFLLFSKRK